MFSTVFHALGTYFDVDGYLAKRDLRPYSVFRKGEVYGRLQKVHECSGFKISIGADEETYASQQDATVQFLSRHRLDLESLRDFEGVERIVLDCGVSLSSMAAMAEYEVDHGLSKQLGLLEIDLIISVYLVEEAVGGDE